MIVGKIAITSDALYLQIFCIIEYHIHILYDSNHIQPKIKEKRIKSSPFLILVVKYLIVKKI